MEPTCRPSKVNISTDRSIRERSMRQAEASKQAAREAAEAQKRLDRINAARARAQAAQATRAQGSQATRAQGSQATSAQVAQPTQQTAIGGKKTRASLIGAWGCGNFSCAMCYRQT